MADSKKKCFEQLSRGKRSNLIMEFLAFLGHNKKWWLLPIIVILLLMGVLVLLSSSAIAPFLYPLF